MAHILSFRMRITPRGGAPQTTQKSQELMYKRLSAYLHRTEIHLYLAHELHHGNADIMKNSSNINIINFKNHSRSLAMESDKSPG